MVNIKVRSFIPKRQSSTPGLLWKVHKFRQCSYPQLLVIQSEDYNTLHEVPLHIQSLSSLGITRNMEHDKIVKQTTAGCVASTTFGRKVVVACHALAMIFSF